MLVVKQPVLALVNVILCVPALTPETTPEEFTLALGPNVFHVPGPPVLDRDVVELTHTVNVPVVAGGNEFIVSVAVRAQPVVLEVKVTVAVVPPVIPPATPLDVPIVPLAVGELLHVPPPGVELPRVVVKPWQTDREPVIALGNEFTVTTAVT
jgi:hypothetical protein